MAAEHHAFVDPISVCSNYFKFSSEAGLINNLDDSGTVQIMKRVARFVTCAITIPLLTTPMVFYNTLCFAVKGSFALLTDILHAPLLSHTHEEYVNDMNLHLAYAVREIANLFFVSVIAIGYTFDPGMVKTIDGYITNLLTYFCANQEANDPDGGRVEEEA
jgi:hypothetical protein